MAQSKRSYRIPHIGDPQETIQIQQLTTIATVKVDPYGNLPMVVAAFQAAGEYLDNRAGADGESAEVQFIYLGVTFRASCEVSQPEEVAHAEET